VSMAKPPSFLVPCRMLRRAQSSGPASASGELLRETGRRGGRKLVLF
jgi:hypothetical protein